MFGFRIAFQEKQQLIRLLIEKVIVTKNEIKIMHCISPKNFPENMQLCCVGQGRQACSGTWGQCTVLRTAAAAAAGFAC